LSEAIKAAAQPRTLEERISDLLEKGVAAPAEPLASLGSRARPAAAPEPAAPSRTAAPAEPSAGSIAGAALPFGTRASAPDRTQPSSVASPAAKAMPSAPEPKADAQRVIAMPSRYPAAPAASGSATNGALNGQVHGAAGSFGSRGATQPVRPTPAAAEDVARTKEQDHPSVARADTRGAHISEPAPAEVVKAALSEATPSPAPAGPSEELVDAMIELVRREPSSLSVFTSGAAFIGGVSEKGVGVEKSVAAHKKGQSTVPAPQASQADDSVPELDGAAAELLRPMLRQWLAENMPRIVEAALRSEITSGGKGPGKA
jgi:cell pole-organizing protein PopZ